MISIRGSAQRGYFDHGWLKTYHTFSFGDYRDPRHMGFRSLRVINEDHVAPGQGFAPHPHHDMEIITYVLSGELEHRDSLGNGAVIRPGVVQYMSAGSGIEHSEFNPSKTNPVHLIQIWIRPSERGLPPRYEQREFPRGDPAGRWRLLASPDGAQVSIPLRQDAHLFAAALRAGQELSHVTQPERGLWIQVLRGEIRISAAVKPEAPGTEPVHLRTGDGASIENSEEQRFSALEDTEFLLFDLA